MSKKKTSNKAKKTIFKVFTEYLVMIIIAVIISIFIRAYVFQPFYIPSGSMENTLHVGDTIGVNKLSIKTGKVERGEIIVFKDPDNWVSSTDAQNIAPSLLGNMINTLTFNSDSTDVYLIKRVVGIAGDTVECKGEGHPLLVNGVEVKEEYLKEGVASSIAFKVTVPDNHVWVLGDNRNNSGDSRLHQDNGVQGAVSMNNVVGKAFSVLWPFSRMQILYETDAFKNVK